MENAANATADAWDKTLSEANAAFETLSCESEELTSGLKRELGLSGTDRSEQFGSGRD
jgi:hypothetical protein